MPDNFVISQKDLDYQEVSGGACAAVIDHVFDHEVSEEEFNMVDANGDGVLDPEELIDFAEANAHHLGRASQRMFDAGIYNHILKDYDFIIIHLHSIIWSTSAFLLQHYLTHEVVI